MWQMASGWKVRILIDDRSVERRPWMFVEPAADHLPIFGPFVVCIQCRMNADETFAVVPDERDHVFLLAVVHVQLAGGAHKYQGIEVIEILRVSAEILFRDQFRIGAQSSFPKPVL